MSVFACPSLPISWSLNVADQFQDAKQPLRMREGFRHPTAQPRAHEGRLHFAGSSLVGTFSVKHRQSFVEGSRMKEVAN